LLQVLGGYGKLTPVDTIGSNEFLDKLKIIYPKFQFGTAADCGAGIGRVTKYLLLPRFKFVDLIEQSPRLLAAAESYFEQPNNKDDITIPDISDFRDRVNYIVLGLQVTCYKSFIISNFLQQLFIILCYYQQNFEPKPNSYDCIWIQWVIGHLNDCDFITFFRNCATGLTATGVIILKDNMCTIDNSNGWTYVIDCEDSSVARNKNYTNLLLQLSGLKIIRQESQTGFPDELYPVMMTACVPINRIII
jgi:protein N-terminal methyltransferase